jgi:acyl-CoA thioester hydrolase
VIRFAYRLLTKRDGGAEPVVLAEAETVHVVVDREMRKRQLPEPYFSVIRRSMEE